MPAFQHDVIPAGKGEMGRGGKSKWREEDARIYWHGRQACF